MQDVAKSIQSGALFAVGFDDAPGDIRGVGRKKHGFLGNGVVIPFIERGEVDGGELPLFQRM